jgi:antitoxin ParD1/3/4
MQTTEQLTITLPEDLTQIVRSKISSGEYATELDVIRESLNHLVEETNDTPDWMSKDEFDDWLRAEAVPVLEAMDADPSLGLSLEQVRANLAKTHADFRKAG